MRKCQLASLYVFEGLQDLVLLVVLLSIKIGTNPECSPQAEVGRWPSLLHKLYLKPDLYLNFSHHQLPLGQRHQSISSYLIMMLEAWRTVTYPF